MGGYPAKPKKSGGVIVDYFTHSFLKKVFEKILILKDST